MVWFFYFIPAFMMAIGLALVWRIPIALGARRRFEAALNDEHNRSLYKREAIVVNQLSMELITMDPVTDLLHSLHDKGVTLWEENGELRHAAPPHALTAEDLRNIDLHQTGILKFYEHRSSVADAP